MARRKKRLRDKVTGKKLPQRKEKKKNQGLPPPEPVDAKTDFYARCCGIDLAPKHPEIRKPRSYQQILKDDEERGYRALARSKKSRLARRKRAKQEARWEAERAKQPPPPPIIPDPPYVPEKVKNAIARASVESVPCPKQMGGHA